MTANISWNLEDSIELVSVVSSLEQIRKIDFILKERLCRSLVYDYCNSITAPTSSSLAFNSSASALATFLLMFLVLHQLNL